MVVAGRAVAVVVLLGCAVVAVLTVPELLVVCVVVVPAGRRAPVTLFCAIVATDIKSAVAIIAPRNELRVKVFIAVKF